MGKKTKKDKYSTTYEVKVFVEMVKSHYFSPKKTKILGLWILTIFLQYYMKHTKKIIFAKLKCYMQFQHGKSMWNSAKMAKLLKMVK